MKLNSIILSDVLAGQCEKDSAGRTLLGEIKKDPRLTELLWYLEYISRTPGRLEDLVSRTAIADDPDVYRTPAVELNETLKFLQDGTHDFHYAGRFPEPVKAGMYKLMEQHAATAKATLAETKVSKLIFKELDLALIHKVPVPIIGDSRFGKTKGVSVWCEKRPGQARIVTVPESARDWDFFAAHADALGIKYNDRTRIQQLKREVEYVLRNSGLFICYDESHFLTPVNYYKDTPPKRINWVRCQVIDKGVGIAFFATPQSLSQSLERYAAKTKYNLEQWIGRLAPPVILADYYDREELMAVAKVHFTNFPEKLLALICSRAMQSEGYLKSMEFTARYAAALAKERQHRTPTMQDVDEAIERMMPAKRPAQEPVEKLLPHRPKSTFKPALKYPSEPVRDDVEADETAENFPSRRGGLGNELNDPAPRVTSRDLDPA